MKKIFFTILFFLCVICFGKYVKSTILFEKTINVYSNELIENLTIEVLIPLNSSNQKVTLINSSENFTIKNGKAVFRFDKIREKKIDMKFVVDINYLNYERIELNNSERNKYTKESKYVKFSEEIYNTTKNFSDELINYVLDSLKWVEKNIEYSYPYADVNYKEVYENIISSDLVMKNRKGVCDEFSHLLASFLRIKNIPTRIVVGELLANDKWIPHAWVEFYHTKYGWLEVDPTTGEFINLYPFRVRYLSEIDVSEVYEKVSGISKGNITMKTDTKIDIINYSKEVDLDVQVKYIDNEEKETLLLFIKNNENSPIFTKLKLIVPNEIKCDDCEKDILLEENSQENLKFVLNLPKMEKNIKYTFPIIVLTDFKEVNSSFSRLTIEVAKEEKEEIINERMRLFIGIFLITMIGIIIVAIIKKW